MKNMTFSREKFIDDEDFLRKFLGNFFWGGEQGEFFGHFWWSGDFFGDRGNVFSSFSISYYNCLSQIRCLTFLVWPYALGGLAF